MLNWDFFKLSNIKYETNTHEITADFKNISISTDTSEILILPSSDGKCRVISCEQEKIKHSVTVEGETLTVNRVDTRKWYEHISIFSIGEPKITLYLPKTEYGALLINSSTGEVDLPEGFVFNSIDVTLSTGDITCRASASGDIRIKTSTGDILLENIYSHDIDLAVTTGKITASSINCEERFHIYVSTGDARLKDVACRSLTSGGSTGRLSLTGVIAEDSFDIKRSTGDVRFDSCDAREILIKTDTGKVSGSLLSEKVFVTNTDTGRVSVPKTTAGGRCEITTSTGDIDINIK